jgi:hypothetical protein
MFLMDFEDWTDIFVQVDKAIEAARQNNELQARMVDTIASFACIELYPKAWLVRVRHQSGKQQVLSPNSQVPSMQPRLLQTFFHCLVAVSKPDPRFDAQYVAAIISLDQLQHPLLRECVGLPAPDPETRIYNMDVAHFLESRTSIIGSESPRNLAKG